MTKEKSRKTRAEVGKRTEELDKSSVIEKSLINGKHRHENSPESLDERKVANIYNHIRPT